MFKKFLLLTLPTVAAIVLLHTGSASACGGLFCQNTPVDQVGERIVFTVNDDDTVTSLVEIQYFGSAEDFAWVLPIPEAIAADDLAVPEDGQTVFDELHALTDVRIIAPETPQCARELEEEFMETADMAADDAGAGVEVFASGEVGPFGFDVIGSDDATALLTWLQDNNYRVESFMEPFIDLYVDEQFAFIAMRLLDGETSESIQPIEITYPGTKPMIPLRLTAVAAQNDMPVFTWIYADAQAVPENYEHFEIKTEDITFFNFGGNDYQSQILSKADELGGRAFITEYAAPSSTLEVTHPWLLSKTLDHAYVTRLTTAISPVEMTVDPMFTLDPSRPDVSNIKDASEMTGLYECERLGLGGSGAGLFSTAGDSADDGATGAEQALAGDDTSDAGGETNFTALWIVIGAVGAIGLVLLGRQSAKS